MVPVALTDAVDGSVFAATVTVLVFTVQYTLSSPWWNDPIGRTVVFKDLALLILLIPASLSLIWPSWLSPISGAVLSVVSTALITIAMAWRSVVWFRIRKPWPFQRGPVDDKDS